MSADAATQVVWVRAADADEGNEVKLFVPRDGHVADILRLSAERVRFGGRAAVEGEICARTARGDPLPARKAVADLTAEQLGEPLTVSVRAPPRAPPQSELCTAGTGLSTSDMPPRAGSWGGAEAAPAADLGPRGTTWAGGLLRDDANDDDVEGDTPGLPDRAEHHSWPGHTDAKHQWGGEEQAVGAGGARDEEDVGAGMPPRSHARTWAGDDTLRDGDGEEGGDDGAEPAEGAAPGVPPAVAAAPPQPSAPPQPEPLRVSGGAAAASLAATFAPPPPHPAQATPHSPPGGSGTGAGPGWGGGEWTGGSRYGYPAGSLVDTTGDGIADSVMVDTIGDGIGDAVQPLPQPPQLLETPATPGDRPHRDQPMPAYPGAHGGGAPAVYIDRIPPDVSDALLIAAVDQQLPPLGMPKVLSLEVIRNQHTRHCHAFAFLRQPTTISDGEMQTINIDHGAGHIVQLGGVAPAPLLEQVRVQRSDKRRDVPKHVTPRATLHVRVYARRGGWATRVARMLWPGLLALIEAACPGATDYLKIVADDRSKKNVNVHRSVLLCAFFAECNSVQCAEELKRNVSDRRVHCNGVTFLLQCDYTMENKRLHDTCRRRDTLHQQYDTARIKARHAVAAARDVREGPATITLMLAEDGSSDFFEFTDDDRDGFQDYLTVGDMPPGRGAAKGRGRRGGDGAAAGRAAAPLQQLHEDWQHAAAAGWAPQLPHMAMPAPGGWGPPPDPFTSAIIQQNMQQQQHMQQQLMTQQFLMQQNMLGAANGLAALPQDPAILGGQPPGWGAPATQPFHHHQQVLNLEQGAFAPAPALPPRDPRRERGRRERENRPRNRGGGGGGAQGGGRAGGAPAPLSPSHFSTLSDSAAMPKMGDRWSPTARKLEQERAMKDLPPNPLGNDAAQSPPPLAAQGAH